MPNVPYFHVDAFADRAFGGNQAAVMLLDSWLDDAVLQAIGAENNFAETAFLVPDASDAADYELTWFTPTSTVDLCGHATLASGHVVLTALAAERETVSFSSFSTFANCSLRVSASAGPVGKSERRPGRRSASFPASQSAILAGSLDTRPRPFCWIRSDASPSV